jgi:hypothetical protein
MLEATAGSDMQKLDMCVPRPRPRHMRNSCAGLHTPPFDLKTDMWASYAVYTSCTEFQLNPSTQIEDLTLGLVFVRSILPNAHAALDPGHQNKHVGCTRRA